MTVKIKDRNKIKMSEITAGMLIMGLIGIVIIILWRKNEAIQYISSVLLFDRLLFGIVCGLAAAGFLQIYIVIIVKIGKANFPDTPDSNMLLELLLHSNCNAILLAVLAGVFEEILFRAAMLGFLNHFFDTTIGFFIVTILFGVIHIPQYKGRIYLIVYMFLFGACLNFLFIWTEALWAPIFAHIFNNYFVAVWVRKRVIRIFK